MDGATYRQFNNIHGRFGIIYFMKFQRILGVININNLNAI